jgi:hypothetical protein
MLTSTAEVFVYHWGDTVYPTVVAEIEGVLWVVMGEWHNDMARRSFWPAEN